jgi:formamidopyrimidine-DNA glycosylase
MPELPEVETTIRGLRGYLDNRRIQRVELRREGLRRPFPADLVQVLTGARITSLSRRAKYGLVHTDRDMTMVFHLGMAGRWRIEPDALEKHDHLVLTTQEEGPCPPPCWRSTMRGGSGRWIWCRLRR